MTAYPSQIASRTDPNRAAGAQSPPGHRLPDTTPPKDLTPAAQTLWNTIAPALADSGALTSSDRVMLAELVEALSLAHRYRREELRMLHEGSVTEHSRGGKPYTTEAAGSQTLKRVRAARKDAMQTVLRLAPEFGLTPKARMAMGLMEASGHSFIRAIAEMTTEDD